MKRSGVLVMVLGVLTATGCWAQASGAVAAPSLPPAGGGARPGYSVYDLNRDGAFDAVDITLLASYQAEVVPTLPYGPRSADVNGDGAVDASDLVEALVTLLVTGGNPAFTPTVMNLPIVTITTTGGAPIVSDEVYVAGRLNIDPNGADPAFAYDGAMQIKGRGHSTWSMPKKPYKVKLSAKASLLGFPADKEWVLLANFADKTLLRNAVAMELSRRFALPYTPRSTFVEVFVNGQYDGTYLLIEQIKIAANRVNIPEMSAADLSGDALTGGYLLEVDVRLDGPSNFVTHHGVPIVLKDPEPPAAPQLAYIRDYVQQAEDALFSAAFQDAETGYAPYLDVDSFIGWYLVNEIFKNTDADFTSSCWMYKNRLGKLFMGPVWDFDLGAGNENFNEAQYTTGWWVRSSPWYSRLFEDPAFALQVQARWEALKAEQIMTVFDFIDQLAATLEQAQQNNFSRWPILDEPVWPSPVVTGSYAGEVAYLKAWLSQRLAWMDAQF